MADNPIINIVATQCQPADVEKFNNWYNNVHIPMLMKSDKLMGVQRYRVMGKSEELPRFIAIYKFASFKDFEDYSASPELAAALAEMKETWGQTVELTSRVQYELIKEWAR